MSSAPPKACLCKGKYLGTALTCAKCGLINAAAGDVDVAVKHEAKDADEKEAKAAAGAHAAAAAGAAGGQLVPAVAGDLDLAMEVLTQQPNERVAAVLAVAANPQQFGDVVTTLADNPQVLAAAQVSIADQIRELQVRQQVVGAAQQLRNLHKRVYYVIDADRPDPLVMAAMFVNMQTGVVTLIPPANVSVQNVIDCTYLLVYPTSVNPQTHRTIAGATGAGWLLVDNVKIVMAAHTSNPAVPVGLRFVLGGRYHLAWGGLSLARCNNLPRTVQMAVKNGPAAPADGAAAAAGAGAGAKVEVMSE